MTRAGPQPPCGGAQPVPPYAALGAAPSVATWKNEAARWAPPSCLPWPDGQYRMLIAVAGSFRHQGDAAALLGRLGTVSKRKGMRYWSVSDKAWRVLITDAAALAAPKAGERRADFAPAEMKPGVELFYEESDNRSSAPVVYRMRVLEADAQRIAVASENVIPVRAFLATLFPPGSLRAACFLERREPGTWVVYMLSATGSEASALATRADASYVNRATALYRYLTRENP